MQPVLLSATRGRFTESTSALSQGPQDRSAGLRLVNNLEGEETVAELQEEAGEDPERTGDVHRALGHAPVRVFSVHVTLQLRLVLGEATL